MRCLPTKESLTKSCRWKITYCEINQHVSLWHRSLPRHVSQSLPALVKRSAGSCHYQSLLSFCFPFRLCGFGLVISGSKTRMWTRSVSSGRDLVVAGGGGSHLRILLAYREVRSRKNRPHNCQLNKEMSRAFLQRYILFCQLRQIAIAGRPMGRRALLFWNYKTVGFRLRWDQHANSARN